MAQLKEDTITIEDIEQYSREYSDFSFELSVASEVRSFGIEVFGQSGIYTDPVTGKPREYDVRARKFIDGQKPLSLKGQVLFAIECKNIRDYCPLVVHCIRRDPNKAYQNVVYNPSDHASHFLPNQQIILKERDGLYLSTQNTSWVGMSIDQVGRDTNNKIKATDSGVYNKIAQATHSAHELVESVSIYTNPVDIVSMILPVLVVPDNRLFVIKYNDNLPSKPELAEFVSMYSGYEISIRYGSNSMAFTYSHIDIVTISGLRNYTKRVFNVLAYLIGKADRIRSVYKNLSHILQ